MNMNQERCGICAGIIDNGYNAPSNYTCHCDSKYAKVSMKDWMSNRTLCPENTLMVAREMVKE